MTDYDHELKTKRVRLTVIVTAEVPETCESSELYLDGDNISVFEPNRYEGLDVAQGPVTWETVNVEVIQ